MRGQVFSFGKSDVVRRESVDGIALLCDFACPFAEKLAVFHLRLRLGAGKAAEKQGGKGRNFGWFHGGLLLFDVSDKRCRHRQPEKSGILPEIRLETQARIMRNRLQSQQPVGIEGSLKAPKRVFRLPFVFYTARQPENG